MNKKLQLRIMVFLSMIIVVFTYLYISRGFSFGISRDIQSLGDSVGLSMNQLSESGVVEGLQEGLKSLKERLKNEQNDEFESKITEKVLNQISQKKDVVYEHEPWGIGFIYDSLMIKNFNQKDSRITLFYEEIPEVKVLIERNNLEGTFNDWLNNNYDLQNLDKNEYNNLIFWKNDLSNNENRIEEYYLNLGNNIFIINLQLPKEREEIYWESLENVIKSFNL